MFEIRSVRAILSDYNGFRGACELELELELEREPEHSFTGKLKFKFKHKFKFKFTASPKSVIISILFIYGPFECLYNQGEPVSSDFCFLLTKNDHRLIFSSIWQMKPRQGWLPPKKSCLNLMGKKGISWNLKFSQTASSSCFSHLSLPGLPRTSMRMMTLMSGRASLC